MRFVIELPDRNLAARVMVLARRWRELCEGWSSTEPGGAKSRAEEVRVIAVWLYQSSAVGDAEQLALPVFCCFEVMDLHWDSLQVCTSLVPLLPLTAGDGSASEADASVVHIDGGGAALWPPEYAILHR
jgi:hypothetical protein